MAELKAKNGDQEQLTLTAKMLDLNVLTLERATAQLRSILDSRINPHKASNVLNEINEALAELNKTHTHLLDLIENS